MNVHTLSASLAPWWAVMPMAAVAMLVIASHVLLLGTSDMPASRRRIRAANGLLMMFTLPLAAYALGVADPAARPRPFLLAWMLVSGLVMIVLLVALADVVNTLRLHRRERRALVLGLAGAGGSAEPAGKTV